MRKVMYFALGLTAVGLVMTQIADRMSATTAAYAMTVIDMPATSAINAPRKHAVDRDSRGHFQTDAKIDGQLIRVMVDTGASVVALNQTTAARFGLRPAEHDFSANVATANGMIKAARARLPLVTVGDLAVRDVEAMILPDDALKENLLGLSFLSRLTRLEFANGRMVLEQ